MHEEEDVALNVKAIGLAVGGAALAGLLFVLARRDDKPEPADQVEAVIADVKDEAEKAAKAAKKKRKKLKKAAAGTADRLADEVKETAETLAIDAKAAERELKAAAWDAQQRAQEAESRLRAAGLRVVDDASHLASKVGAEARHLADEGRERIAHLRHRDEGAGPLDDEVARLRAEIEELRGQLAGAGRKAEKDSRALTARLKGKTGPIPEEMASEAVSAALAQIERSLKTKAPALLAAKNRGQVLEILQQELGPTLRESLMQGATAALGLWDAARERSDEPEAEARAGVREVADDARASIRKLRSDSREKADDARDAVDESVEAAKSNGKHRFWRESKEAVATAAEADAPPAAEERDASKEEHKSKAGLFWGGAGLGLALYALLDAERRDHVLRLANEASIQVQELVRDLQGYDDEF